jgi:hypothetical protein
VPPQKGVPQAPAGDAVDVQPSKESHV